MSKRFRVKSQNRIDAKRIKIGECSREKHEDGNETDTEDADDDSNSKDSGVIPQCSARCCKGLANYNNVKDKKTAKKIAKNYRKKCFQKVKPPVFRSIPGLNAPLYAEKALLILHNQLVHQEAEFQYKLHELETNFSKNRYEPLLKLRSKLIRAVESKKNVDRKSTKPFCSMGRKLETILEESEPDQSHLEKSENQDDSTFKPDESNCDDDDNTILKASAKDFGDSPLSNDESVATKHAEMKGDFCSSISTDNESNVDTNLPIPSAARKSFISSLSKCTICDSLLINDKGCECNKSKSASEFRKCRPFILESNKDCLCPALDSLTDFEKCQYIFKQSTGGKQSWRVMCDLMNKISIERCKGIKSAACGRRAIPINYWVKVFTHSSSIIRNRITKADMKLLSHVNDVKINYITFNNRYGIFDWISPSARGKSLNKFIKKPNKEKGSPALDPSARRQLKDKKHRRAIGFEIVLCFEKNPIICNRHLTKKYVIDFKPHSGDYKAVKNRRICTNALNDSSFGRDDSSVDEPCHMTRSRPRNPHINAILNYSGPRLIAVEGCDIKWKPHRGEGKFCSQHSFFDFFGVFWNNESNILNIVRKNGHEEFHKRNCVVQPRVEKDYNTGKYIKDVLCPRAHALYLQEVKFTPRKKIHESDSLVESISSGESDSKCAEKQTCDQVRRCADPPSSEQTTLKSQPAFLPEVLVNMPCQKLPENANLGARFAHTLEEPLYNPEELDDVDDFVKIHRHNEACSVLSNIDELDGDPVHVRPSVALEHAMHHADMGVKASDSLDSTLNSIEQSRREIKDVVKNVNEILLKGKRDFSETTSTIPTIEYNPPLNHQPHQIRYQPLACTPVCPPRKICHAADSTSAPFRPPKKPKCCKYQPPFPPPPYIELAMKNFQERPLIEQNVRLPCESDISRSAGGPSKEGNVADDEDTWTECNADRQSVNAAFKNIKYKLKNGTWKAGVGEYDKANNGVGEVDEDIQSSLPSEHSSIVQFRKISPFPSKENVKIDDSDVLSSDNNTSLGCLSSEEEASSSDASSGRKEGGIYPSARAIKKPRNHQQESQSVYSKQPYSNLEQSICNNLLSDERQEMDNGPTWFPEQDEEKEEEMIPSEDSESPEYVEMKTKKCNIQ